MILKNSIVYLFICTIVLAPNQAKADNSANIPKVQTKDEVADPNKEKPVNNNSQSYPAPNEAFRNDGKTPSTVSSPELSGAGDRKNAFPEQIPGNNN